MLRELVNSSQWKLANGVAARASETTSMARGKRLGTESRAATCERHSPAALRMSATIIARRTQDSRNSCLGGPKGRLSPRR